MADLVNLHRVRKAKAKLKAKEQAAENRARFGRTLEQRRNDGAAARSAARKLDGVRLDE